MLRIRKNSLPGKIKKDIDRTDPKITLFDPIKGKENLTSNDVQLFKS